MTAVLCLLALVPTSRATAAPEAAASDLRSGTPAVRAHAATALGRLGRPSAVPVLIEALRDEAPAVRREAAKALGVLKDPRAVEGLLAALRDADTNVRTFAAYALGEIKDRKATQALLNALRDPEWTVRDQAAWALRELRNPSLVGPLVSALKDKDADLPHVEWLLRHAEGDLVVGQLGALLQDEDAQVRLRAVRTLAKFADPKALDPLIAALPDDSPAVRRAAVEALGKLGDQRARDPLKALAEKEQDPAVRKALETVLFQMSREGDLLCYWSFDDKNPEVATDVTGRGNDGIIKGCTVAEGKVGHGLKFAEGKYIRCGKPPAMIIGGRPLTIMAWVKSEADDGVVISRGGAFCGFSLYLKDGLPKFGIHQVQDGPAYIAAGKEPIGDGWVHLAGIVKQDRVELYLNGQLTATAKAPGYIPGECGQGMEIGYDEASSPCEIMEYFEGVLDEVKVYGAALTEAEIAEQAGLVG